MAGQCGCAKCCFPACPPQKFVYPYDEVSHEIQNNVLSIRVAKDLRQIEGIQGEVSERNPTFDVSCSDAYGKKCKTGCAKVNVIPNKVPPAKKPEEEMFLLRATKQIMNTDELKNSLEIEFKAPRNYIPKPDPGPAPPIIQIATRQGKKSGKGKKGKKKATKK
ncbi:uncharacterized protein LOC112494955 [Cephus cinctus]|uniref:Uncharacterized protein LOC112494955 n=1 Tax=Cephus cinctus TaxID=211228 RepID=A0AAJ7RPM7_CEPCN|nr:uncharacterized protein LOC112494955 [Cephus cinctus]